MLLIHNIVGIYAGDRVAFPELETLSEQENKESATANRLFGLLPEKQF
ncbi:MAG: putative hydrolase of HD superfamily [Arenicella sp.]|jgi:putative hydrolase of HD superfamily